jgi:hypothetical protein
MFSKNLSSFGVGFNDGLTMMPWFNMLGEATPPVPGVKGGPIGTFFFLVSQFCSFIQLVFVKGGIFYG